MGMPSHLPKDKRVGGIAELVREVPLQKFQAYTFRIDPVEPFDPASAMVDVRLRTELGEEYWANFTTVQYLAEMFEKNRRTGECLSGTYFCMPDNMVIVNRIDEETVRKTIEDLIRNRDIEAFFKKYD